MRAAAWTLLAAVLLVGGRAAAVAATPLSAGTQPAGTTAVSGFLGFPYLEVRADHGFASSYDAGVVARSAWGNIQRLGAGARMRFSGSGDSGFAARLLVDAWLRRPEGEKWINITGQQDVSGALDLLYSWTTSRGTVMTLDGTYFLVGTRQPPPVPLGGVPPSIAFGSNLGARLSAEIPTDRGLVLSFLLGMDFHLSGFDAALAMPVFAVGVGYAP